MHQVAVLALENVVPFDLGIPARVLGAAQADDGSSLYRVTTCAIGGGTVRTSGDLSLLVEHDERALAVADTIVVATQEPEGRLRERGELEPEVSRALASIRAETRVVSLCTGSFVLAAAGLLDGLEATTHWGYSDLFARLFPQVDLRPDVLFVDAGRVLTAAGAAAGIDLCLHLIRRDHGAAVANAAARRCVVPPWREGGQAQYIERPVPSLEAASTGPTRAWASDRLTARLTLADLAGHAGVSVRTFSRRFQAEVGVSPMQWLSRQRVDRARSLLETSDLPVESVAYEAGFTSATVLRQQLRASLGVTPQAYRRTFRAPDR
ncbi:MAG: GlxA family transcriptional regulator [Solirubrobacterales bacterium]